MQVKYKIIYMPVKYNLTLKPIKRFGNIIINEDQKIKKIQQMTMDKTHD